MKSATSKTIANYKFQDSRRIAYVTGIGNALLAFGFLMAENKIVVSNPYFWMCIMVAVLFTVINFIYSWKNAKVNVLIILFYLGIVVVELASFGMPPNTIRTTPGISKGVMLEIIGGLLPMLYVFLRICLIFPLVNVTIRSKHLFNN